MVEQLFGSTNMEVDESTGALFEAVRRSRYRQAKLLLEAGIDPDIRNNEQETPLMNTVIYVGNPETRMRMVKMLVYFGAGVNLQDERGQTVLMQACILNQADTISFLLQHEHLSLDIADYEGNTALMYASAFGYTDIVNQFLEDFRLLRHLLNVNAENDHGKTAFTLALDNGHITVARMLCLEIQRYQVFLESFTDSEKVAIGLTEESPNIDYSQLYEVSKTKPGTNAVVSPYGSGQFAFLSDKAPTYAEVAAMIPGQSEKKSRKKKRKKSQRKGKLERENTNDSTTSVNSVVSNKTLGTVSTASKGITGKRTTENVSDDKNERVVIDGGEVFLKTDGVISAEKEIGIKAQEGRAQGENDGDDGNKADDAERPHTRRDEMTPSTAYLQMACEQLDAATNDYAVEADQLLLSARNLSFKWSPESRNVLPKIGATGNNQTQPETSDFKLPPIKDALPCRDSPLHRPIKLQTLDADLINSGREFLSPAMLTKNREKRRSSLTMDTTNTASQPSTNPG